MATSTKPQANGKKAKLETISVGRQPAQQIGAFNLPGDEPWSAEFTLRGTSSYIFHRYTVDDGDGPAAKKGSNKHDIPENYVYRCEDGTMGVPAEHVRQAMVAAGKWHKDPKGGRASAMGTLKAAIVLSPEIASVGSVEWDYLDRRGAVVQRSRILRVRPALAAGWEATFRAEVLLPEYLTPALLQQILTDAGRLCGLGEMRPQFGRFVVARFDVL